MTLQVPLVHDSLALFCQHTGDQFLYMADSDLESDEWIVELQKGNWTRPGVNNE
jgi:hypothetical protein